ncbi:MAG: phosphatase PAP2 family protein [Gammaproteobacteria bacterium]|nr:MAG: phosphatase PAP2 family protein [Gammaproteobacteria bacterium]
MKQSSMIKPLLNLILALFVLISTSVFCVEKTKTENIGNDIQHIILAAGLGASIFYEEGNEGTYQFLTAVVVSQIFVHELKDATQQTRPNGKCCHSFPSGHASASFTSAAFIHDRYGWEYAVPAYIASTYVSYSRVYADKHFEKDVVAGAIVGLISGFYFTDKYEDIKILPVVNNKQVGIYVSYDF